MKKIFTLGIIAATGCLGLMAEPVTPAQALARLNSDSQARRVVGRHYSNKMRQVAELPELYVFSSGNGFMILPADDVARPLLAYSDSGEFDLDGNPALKWWLSTYSDQIAEAAEAGVEDTGSEPEDRQPISPLIQTRWNQSAPYNDMTPEIDGVHAVTGCVATAMAQAMKYHNYPPKGTGTHSYVLAADGQTVSFDFGATTFDWDNMLDTYGADATAEQKEAVATLMKACGVSVDMNYTTDESGARSSIIGSSLIDYFGYDKGLWQPQRAYYGLDEWQDMIYADLEQGLPVLYCGTGSAGGHQFICDGYSTGGFFHFNWGWGGMSDGYFQLTALDPPSLGIGGGAGGFNSNQAVVLGMRPPVEGSKAVELVYCTGNFEAVSQTAELGNPVVFTGGCMNSGCFALPVGTEFGLEVTPVAGGETQYLLFTKLTSEMPPSYGYGQIEAVFPQDMAEGSYIVKPAYKPVDGEWQAVRAELGANGELTATVSGSTVTFTANDAPEIQATNLQATSAFYWGSPFTLTFDVTNEGTQEYYGTLIPCLFSADGENTLIAEANTYPVDIQAGESSTISYTGKFSSVSSSTPEAGNYMLVIMSSATGQAVGEPIEITLNAAPTQTVIGVSDFEYVSQTADTATFRMTISCSEGYFAGNLTVAVFSNASDYSVASGSTSSVYIAAGESAQVEATVDISGLTYGDYKAGVFNRSKQATSLIEFTIADEITSISAPEENQGNAITFDLHGRQVKSPSHGIFIRGGKKVLL